ncbi:hypothetical protein ACQKMV_10765, partial [Lysinibacillus sp. NPDC094403]|uniref:hypothetical protein n=1 Tax=Lysinibacillus sp. NPDC094403 TaxID=3390581 RepID=UPI003D01138E
FRTDKTLLLTLRFRTDKTLLLTLRFRTDKTLLLTLRFRTDKTLSLTLRFRAEQSFLWASVEPLPSLRCCRYAFVQKTLLLKFRFITIN